MNVKRIGFFCLAFNVVAATASAQNVKVTPLGSHTGEFCATDRALIFEDPTGYAFFMTQANRSPVVPIRG